MSQREQYVSKVTCGLRLTCSKFSDRDSGASPDASDQPGGSGPYQGGHSLQEQIVDLVEGAHHSFYPVLPSRILQRHPHHYRTTVRHAGT